jgi:hypothetical protein
MPQIAKELPAAKGARGVQTLYMTETMKINRTTRATTDTRTVSFQAPIDGSH